MKIFFVILLLISVNNSNGQNTLNDKQSTEQEGIDKNSKSITLLTIAVSGLSTLIIGLLLYIKNSHSKDMKAILGISNKFIEATMKINSTSETLSTSIANSGVQISGAIDRIERTTDELHKFIISNLYKANNDPPYKSKKKNK